MGRVIKKKRTVRISPEMRAELDEQRERFKQKFGRYPGLGDPVFFDPNSDTPQRVSEQLVDAEITRAMAVAGIDPSIIYAYRKTGLLVSESNWARLSQKDRDHWNQAIDEYHLKIDQGLSS
ncbi:MAG: hypothetical protein WA324_19850 [Bryobacteraceae bacterium]